MNRPTIPAILFGLLVASTSLTALSANEVVVAYEYIQKPQVDFSKATKGSLKISVFTDIRHVSDPRALSEELADQPVSVIVRSALEQAFIAGGAAIVEDGQSLTLEGELTEVTVSLKEGAYEVTIRTHITLKRGSQTAFDTVIFGRASGELLDQAVRATLDKLVNSLLLDDYFLMEVL